MSAKAQLHKSEGIYTDCVVTGDQVKSSDLNRRSKPVAACPIFPGGVPAMKKFFAVYTHSGSNKKGEQKVVISFVIEKNGRLQHPRVEQHVSPKIDNLALKQVNSSPIWKPAILKGKPVRFLIALPINVVSN